MSPFEVPITQADMFELIAKADIESIPWVSFVCSWVKIDFSFNKTFIFNFWIGLFEFSFSKHFVISNIFKLVDKSWLFFSVSCKFFSLESIKSEPNATI